MNTNPEKFTKGKPVFEKELIKGSMKLGGVEIKSLNLTLDLR